MDELRAAEEDLEAAWCNLDREWHRLLAEASDEAARVVRAAHDDAAEVVAAARTEATAVVEDAHAEAAALLLEAQERADRLVADARRSALAEIDTDLPEDPTGIREALQRLRLQLSNVVDAALDAFPTIEATAELFADADGPVEAQPDPEAAIDLTAEADGATVDLGVEEHRTADTPVEVVIGRPRRLRRLLRLAR